MMIGGFLLMSMMALTCLDVVGRLFGYPIFGTYELVTFMAALVTAAALPDTHAEKRHIGVEIVTNMLSSNVRRSIDLVTSAVALILFMVVTWRLFLLGTTLRRSGEVSMNLRLPEYMITYAVGLGFLIFVVIIIKRIVDTFNTIRES